MIKEEKNMIDKFSLVEKSSNRPNQVINHQYNIS